MADVVPRQTTRGGSRRREYLPERAYAELQDRPDAWRVVARCVARFATRYEAGPVGNPSVQEAGPMPRAADGREALVDDLWTQICERQRSQFFLLLYAGGDQILDQHDGGLAAVLRLSSAEFHHAQDCWQRQGVPRDFYYLRSEARVVPEPTRIYGGVVMTTRPYTPLEWVRREAEEDVEQLTLPTEKERETAFVDDCTRFNEAINRRRLELREPGKELDRELLEALDALGAFVLLTRVRARGFNTPQIRRDLRALTRALNDHDSGPDSSGSSFLVKHGELTDDVRGSDFVMIEGICRDQAFFLRAG